MPQLYRVYAEYSNHIEASSEPILLHEAMEAAEKLSESHPKVCIYKVDEDTSWPPVD